MVHLTKSAIVAVLGPVDDALAAVIAATGASEAELAEAKAWLASDEALVNEGRALPAGRVGDLIELLQEAEEPDEL